MGAEFLRPTPKSKFILARGGREDGKGGECIDEGEGVVSEHVVQAEVCGLRGRGSMLREAGEGFNLSQGGGGLAG